MSKSKRKQEILDNEKIDIIDKIVNMLPEIKKKRNYLIDQILTPKSLPGDEYVLEKITVNGNHYYRDRYKCILDDNAELVGVWEWDFTRNNYNYYIFKDEKEKIDKIRL